MHRYILIVALICYQTNIFAQIGINTNNALGVLHIHPNDSISISATDFRNTVSADFIISKEGNIGINTVNPHAKISVENTGENTGLQLTNGAKKGYILVSDTIGNAHWTAAPKKHQTYVTNRTIMDQTITTRPRVPIQITTLGDALVDTAKEQYGDSYGWNSGLQQYKVPLSGLYRLTSQIYFLVNQLGGNYRTYWILNGTMNSSMGLYSYIDVGKPLAAYISNIFYLNKDDILYLGAYSNIPGNASTTIKYRQGVGYTFIQIEILQAAE